MAINWLYFWHWIIGHNALKSTADDYCHWGGVDKCSCGYEKGKWTNYV